LTCATWERTTGLAFITERLFNRLSSKLQAQASGLNQTVSAQATRLCYFSIRAPNKPGLQLETVAYVLPELAGKLPPYQIPRDERIDLHAIPLSDLTFLESSQIDVLIGADILQSVLLSGTRTSICGSLLGQETIFGWVLTGPVASTSSQNRVSAFTTQITETSDRGLEKLLTKFWEVENIPTKRLKESDSYCESNFLQTTTRDASGRYVVTLPFRKPENFGSELGHSRSIALAQFLRNENRLKRDFALKEQYDSVIQEYLDLGHTREATRLTILQAIIFHTTRWSNLRVPPPNFAWFSMLLALQRMGQAWTIFFMLVQSYNLI